MFETGGKADRRRLILHFAEPFGGNTALHAFAVEGFAEVAPYACALGRVCVHIHRTHSC